MYNNKILYKNKHALVILRTIENGEYVYISKPYKHAVLVVVYNKTKDQVFMVKQYRLPLNKQMLQFVMGAVDKNEYPLKAAKRELLEETGIVATDWKKIGILHAEPGLSDQTTHIFCAVEKSRGQSVFEDEGNVIKGQYLSPNEINDLVKKQKITCGFTLSALKLAGI